MDLNSKKAYELLIKDVDDLNAKYITHSKYVAESSRRIAEKLGIDSNKAMALGYIHDIGRKINTESHPISGYNYLKENGYSDYAFICLTHSYLNNDIDCAAGGYVNKEAEYYDFLNDFIKNYEYTIYDKIVQFSDLICMSTGFTILEKRIIDLILRRGVHNNTVYHIKEAQKLKEELEEQLNCSIYSLFPEIIF